MCPTSEPGGTAAVDHGPYADLDATDPAHWAFGTGFADPLAGIDPELPEGLDRTGHAALCLLLGDDALVYSHRLSEWCSRAPDLEDDVALGNIALDLLGQARLLLARAAVVDPTVVPAMPVGSPVPAEDALAFFRDAPAYHSSRTAALANGDFGHTVLRLFLWSTVRLAVLQRLVDHPDPVLAAIAAKGVKELTYHRDWSGRWVVTLAQGTEESRGRMVAAFDALAAARVELLGRYPDAGVEAEDVLDQLLDAAELRRPEEGADAGLADDLPDLLAELQSVARAHPMGRW
ncbi:MAG TPA: 1,2-phenylacetyl-CoA epoxidase subunit PaaC [Nocardioides sp.]|uniref:1,2-phenylacetyl-CoA epoxidase subunit PaaC n=1 Tax=Nocardioides sp. TaxID=35761 RepID=UPI002CB13DBE|nr:1,2-phenylacetyl-CoA epoxidase subunit PaaC [Nocardioides sp.]HTW17404.1 1,2-phenylacetyl-CoA epoxidase subunit PaaC [Nocardioides sp.]